jgi:hypothetical protein
MKEDPPTMKKLPVEVDVCELLVKVGLASGASEKTKAVGDLCLIAFYYLLRIAVIIQAQGHVLRRSRQSSFA